MSIIITREGLIINTQSHKFVGEPDGGRGSGLGGYGFTLIELLVVLSVTSVLSAILVPTLAKAKRQARVTIGMCRQRSACTAVNLFAVDNNDSYPKSVATVGPPGTWNWTDPRKTTATGATSPGAYRAMSEYLGSYIEDASAMYCPSAPRQYKYLQAAWDAGDDWDNPENNGMMPGSPDDPVTGTYCFYWNYDGFIVEWGDYFVGPQDSAGGRWQSKLLMSDHFGYGNSQNDDTWGSCERYNLSASTRPGDLLSADFWINTDINNLPEIKLNAAYTDGHVASYSSSDVVTMEVIKVIATGETYDLSTGGGPGEFYLPRLGL